MTTPEPTTVLNARSAIEEWARHHGSRLEGLAALPGDLSTRRYFRGQWRDRSVIVAYYPSETGEGACRFLDTTLLLERAGVPVPRVLSFDPTRGIMLLVDAGSQNLYQASTRLGGTATEKAIESAAAWIGPIQRLERDEVAELSPPLDSKILICELEQTWQYYLTPNDLAGPGDELRQALEDLCSNLGQGELVPCHRDFMARNVLLADVAEPSLTLIDHQDLRLGPRFYDLASLLNDSLFAGPTLEESLLRQLAPSPNARVEYHRAVVQRTLKAIGTFCRFAACGHPQHLPLVVPTLQRAWSHLPLVPELSHLPARLGSTWSRLLEATESKVTSSELPLPSQSSGC